MANEALLRNKLEEPVDYTIADTAFEKGATLQLTDARTASAATGSTNAGAGILAREMLAGDGRTQCAVFMRGIFDMVASGAITVGNPVSFAEANHVIKSTATVSGAAIIGHALETASDQEVFQVYVNVGAGSSGIS